MDATRRGKAERQLLRALERFHREEPMSRDLRVDGLLARVSRSSAGSSPRHRGGGAPLEQAELSAALSGLVERGVVVRDGRRVRLAGGGAGVGPEMRHRADELLAVLRSAAGAPPRAEPVARRLGLPEVVLEGLRSSGELVAIAPGIDYPRDVLDGLVGRLVVLPSAEAASTGGVASALGIPRRYAQALRAYAAQRDSRPVR